MNHKDDAAFQYHRQTYGENFEYDDFLNQWKPTLFNPHTWLDLIDKSGAKYYVFTTKHHDGIALFDTDVTDRSSMHLFEPSRDFVKELINISETSYPHLKRGLYCKYTIVFPYCYMCTEREASFFFQVSLPEWYNPKYNDNSLGWKGPPINPYTDEILSYTGSKPIESFVNELQVPQFQELANKYNPDILWYVLIVSDFLVILYSHNFFRCDIGGIHNSTVWQSDYFNNALNNGRQVTVNDRCGDGSASDFTTIEYKAVTDTPTRYGMIPS